MHLSIRIALVMTVTASACSDDKKTTTDATGATDATDATGGAETTPDAVTGPVLVEAVLAQTLCELLDTCLPYDTSENTLVYLLRGLPPAQCEAYVKRQVFEREGRLDLGIQAGELTVTAAALDACVASLRSSCQFDIEHTCRDLIEGKVAAGGACQSSFDCAGDAFCSYESCGQICTPRGVLGSDCNDDSGCSTADARLACSYESFKCVPASETSNAAKDAPCGEVHAADKVTRVSCATGLVCESELCQPVVAKGGRCEDDHTPCALGSICYPDAPEAQSGTCRELPVADTAGASCDEEYGSPTAVFCNPVLGLGCVDGKCVQGGDGTLGATCFPDRNETAACLRVNYCEPTTAKCAARKADGVACDPDADECLGYCASGAGPALCASASCD